MTDSIHGTPITPTSVLTMLGRRNYCLSFYRPDQIEILVGLAEILMIDNGAFSAWKKGVILDAEYWRGFYEFLFKWSNKMPPGWWFVIPDVIDAGTQEQDALLRECPDELSGFGVPVWHMDEPSSRLMRLIEERGRVCIGSTAEFRVVGSRAWRGRMDDVFDEIDVVFGSVPWVHMLRGMQCLKPTFDYPFSSVDSTDIARNHNRAKKAGDYKDWLISARADRWDAMNCPTTWTPRPKRSAIWSDLF